MKKFTGNATAQGFILLLSLTSALAACSGGPGAADAGGIDATSGGRDARAGGGADSNPDVRTNSCTGQIEAAWTVDGTPYVSSTVLVINLGTAWQMSIVECVNDGVDSTVQLADIPGPVAVGSYPLSFTVLHGQHSTGEAGAAWSLTSGGSVSAETNYFTDLSHTGMLTITAVDAATSTLSGTFSFSAVNDGGTRTVRIADGVLTNVKFAP